MLFFILALVITDMVIKTIIYFNFMDLNVTFFNDYLGFTPYINQDQMSIFNSTFNLGINTTTLIILNSVLLLILVLLYFRIKRVFGVDRHVTFIFILFISGAICSITDKLLLGGSLDYLLISRWICDLKDIYLYTSFVYFVIYSVKNADTSGSIKDDFNKVKQLFKLNSNTDNWSLIDRLIF